MCTYAHVCGRLFIICNGFKSADKSLVRQEQEQIVQNKASHKNWIRDTQQAALTGYHPPL